MSRRQPGLVPSELPHTGHVLQQCCAHYNFKNYTSTAVKKGKMTFKDIVDEGDPTVWIVNTAEFRTVRLSKKGLVFITLLLLALSPDLLSDILKINRSIRSLLVRTLEYRNVHIVLKFLLYCSAVAHTWVGTLGYTVICNHCTVL